MSTRFLSVIISVFTVMLTVFGVSPKAVKDSVPAPEDFDPVLRFVVSSDSHINALGDKGCRRIMKMINTGYAAGENSEYKNLDAVVLVGDITDDGRVSEFLSFKASVDAAVKDGTQFLGVVAKSHDSGTLSRGSLDLFKKITDQDGDCHKVINGFHFIGISVSPDESVHYTDDQIRWLDEQIAEAVAEDPSKPVFVFQHEHIYNTVYGSYPEDGWGDRYFIDTLSKYPQVVDISGHSHYPANDPRAIWQDSFTAINDGGLAYYEFTIDGENRLHPDGKSSMAHFLLVEVDAQNRVLVRVYDLNAEAVMTEFLIDNISETNKTKYDQDVRRANTAAPVFENELNVTKKLGKYVLSTKAATPDNGDVVFMYRLNVINSDGESVYTANQLGDYYKTPDCADVSFRLPKLDKGTYTAQITAEDAWGIASEPLCAEISY